MQEVILGNADERVKGMSSGKVQAIANHYNINFAEICIKDKEAVEDWINALVEKIL